MEVMEEFFHAIALIWAMLWKWPDRFFPLALAATLFWVMAAWLFVLSETSRRWSFLSKHRLVAAALVFIGWLAGAYILASGVSWTMSLYTADDWLPRADRIVYSSHATLACTVLGVFLIGGMAASTVLVVVMAARRGQTNSACGDDCLRKGTNPEKDGRGCR